MDYITVNYISYILNCYPNFTLNDYSNETLLYEFQINEQENGYIVQSKEDHSTYELIYNNKIIQFLNQTEFDLIKPFNLHGIDNIFDWTKIVNDILKNSNEQVDDNLYSFLLRTIDDFNQMLLTTDKVEFFSKPEYKSIYLSGKQSKNLPIFHLLMPDDIMNEDEHSYTLITTLTN